eukprot:CAMPEP_0118864648 /NCGR_PEP_ID=MMETSP1163-20130328/9157_1 /TAXON_ID=124430 /ORGANISM="Phaeomonas parva, Strain CCMP2877" /LENGTH=248 /DNA_ID=CAMNT_0006798795 /DNA_START=63 /DNA_END=809 /DNA_ORIENTATION=+
MAKTPTTTKAQASAWALAEAKNLEPQAPAHPQTRTQRPPHHRTHTEQNTHGTSKLYILRVHRDGLSFAVSLGRLVPRVAQALRAHDDVLDLRGDLIDHLLSPGLHANLVADEAVVLEAHDVLLGLDEGHGALEHLQHRRERLLHDGVNGPRLHHVVLRRGDDVLEAALAIDERDGVRGIRVVVHVHDVLGLQVLGGDLLLRGLELLQLQRHDATRGVHHHLLELLHALQVAQRLKRRVLLLLLLGLGG